MKNIYRIEHRLKPGKGYCNVGPYCNHRNMTYTDIHGSVNDLSRHPAPFEEAGVEEFVAKFDNYDCGELGKFCFGFGDLTTLRRWFNLSEREYLKERGYVIRVYASRRGDYIVTDNQALFLHDNANRLRCHDIISCGKIRDSI